MKEIFLQIDERDNLLVALEDIKAGQVMIQLIDLQPQCEVKNIEKLRRITN